MCVATLIFVCVQVGYVHIEQLRGVSGASHNVINNSYLINVRWSDTVCVTFQDAF